MNEYSSYREPAMGFSAPRITWAVQRIMLLTGFVFIAQLLLEIPFGQRLEGPPGGIFTDYLAFSPNDLLVGYLYQPLTYMFLHSGLSHFFFNMLWLFFFGPEVERVLGTRGFYRFYLVCGAFGVLLTLPPFLLYGANVSVTGASGAVMGVLIAFAMIDPERQFFLFPLPFPINARALVIIVMVINLLNGLSQYSAAGVAGGAPAVSVLTHFGGMAAAFGYMKLLPYWNRWGVRWPRLRSPFRGLGRKSAPHSAGPKGRGGNPDLDKVGKAVDNIFKFDDHGKRPRD